MSSEKFLPLPQEEEGANYAPMMDAAVTSLPTMPSVTMPTASGSGGGGMLSNLFAPTAGRSNHLFCGCCCDTRRATLIVNAMQIILNVVAMILFFVGIEFMEKNASEIAADMDDDEVAKEFENMANDGSLELLEALMDVFWMFSIVLHGFGVYGALYYQKWAIVVSAVGYGIAMFFALIGFDLTTIVWKATFLYPHLALIKEINDGIMTDYNYANVKSCCDAC